jgi:hypothetical protein
MPRSTFVDIPQEEHRQMLAVLRRARYGYLLALHILLLCAAGRRPTTIAAVLCCSRSSVYRTVQAYRMGKLSWEHDEQGQLLPPVRTTGLVPTLRRSLLALAQGPSPGLWLVPYALELRHPGPDAGGQAGPQGVGRDGAPLGARGGLGVEAGQIGRQR